MQLCSSMSILWPLPFFGIGMKTDLFQSCGHCWVFQMCWHIECSTFRASSFRIWNSSTGIPSPPLALFVVMLSKAHLIHIPGCLNLGARLVFPYFTNMQCGCLIKCRNLNKEFSVLCGRLQNRTEKMWAINSNRPGFKSLWKSARFLYQDASLHHFCFIYCFYSFS